MSNSNTIRDSAPFDFGLELTPDEPPEDVAHLATVAESSGMDAVFVSNHYYNRDPFVTLAAIAGATDRIGLGPGIVNPYETHPVRIASQMATLDELCTGRAICGIGAGDRSTLDVYDLPRTKPARTVHESIEVIRGLLAGERVEHEGTFSARAAELNHGDASVPIYVGAQGPVMLRMSAAHGDGVLINAAHPADYRWASTQLDIGLANRSEALGPLQVSGFLSVSVAEDWNAARTAARPPVAFIAAGSPDEVLDRHDIDTDVVDTIQESLSAGERDQAYAAVTRKMIDAFCVAGTPDIVRDRFADLLEINDALVAASPLGPDRRQAIELLGEICDGLRADGVSSG